MKNVVPAPLPAAASLEYAEISASEFVIKEYDTLNLWAMHGDNAINQIFNFYLTLLTAAVGGTILILDTVAGGLVFSLIIVFGIASLVLAIGAVFLASLILQTMRNSYYQYGMLSIQAGYLHSPQVAGVIRERPPFAINDIQTLSAQKESRAWNNLLLLAPVGIQQIFIALVNSLLVVVIIVCLVRLNGPFIGGSSTLNGVIFAFFVSYFAQSIFSRIILNKHLGRCRKMSDRIKAMIRPYEEAE